MDVAQVIGLGQIVVSTAVVAIGGYWTWRKSSRESEESEAREVADHIDNQDSRMDRFERRLEAEIARGRLRDQYISALRRHIDDRLPPPPPPWPDGLTRIPESH